ncbi:transcriptional repressor [Pseudogymnoascus australis]
MTLPDQLAQSAYTLTTTKAESSWNSINQEDVLILRGYNDSKIPGKTPRESQFQGSLVELSRALWYWDLHSHDHQKKPVFSAKLRDALPDSSSFSSSKAEIFYNSTQFGQGNRPLRYKPQPPPVSAHVRRCLTPQAPSRRLPPAASCAGLAPRVPKLNRCDWCQKTFSTSGHTKRHSKIHTSTKDISCTFSGCLKMFTRTDNMKQHLETHKPRLNEWPVECRLYLAQGGIETLRPAKASELATTDSTVMTVAGRRSERLVGSENVDRVGMSKASVHIGTSSSLVRT